MPLAKRTDYGDARFAGCTISFSEEIEPSLQVQSLHSCRFDENGIGVLS